MRPRGSRPEEPTLRASMRRDGCTCTPVLATNRWDPADAVLDAVEIGEEGVVSSPFYLLDPATGMVGLMVYQHEHGCAFEADAPQALPVTHRPSPEEILRRGQLLAE